MTKNIFQTLAIIILSAFLAACGSKYSSSGSRYALAEDTGPAQGSELEYHEVDEIIPRFEPRSKAGNKSPYTVFGKTYHVMKDPTGYEEVGVASWYGAKFHGHKTSNGEIFDMFKISAAHKSLPIPSYVRVTNLANGKSIIVRVNDRGPFHGGRIIDLSYAGAVKLGFEKQGTARVHVELVTPDNYSKKHYYLQLAAFTERDLALDMAKEVTRSVDAKVFVESSDLHRVKVGPLSHKTAEQLQIQLAASEFGKPLLIKP